MLHRDARISLWKSATFTGEVNWNYTTNSNWPTLILYMLNLEEKMKYYCAYVCFLLYICDVVYLLGVFTYVLGFL